LLNDGRFLVKRLRSFKSLAGTLKAAAGFLLTLAANHHLADRQNRFNLLNDERLSTPSY